MSKRAKPSRSITKGNGPFHGLRQLNFWLAGLHLLQGTAIALWSNKTTLPIDASRLSIEGGKLQLADSARAIWHLPLGLAVAAVLLVAAANHMLLSRNGFAWYRRHLKAGTNPARFIEYALGSSMLIVVVAALTGTRDLLTLASIVALNATMNYCGYRYELLNRAPPKASWTPLIVACAAGAAAWAVILGRFVRAGAQHGAVSGIVAVAVAFWCLTDLNLYLRGIKAGRWANYLFVEGVYAILNLVAKSALAWLIFLSFLMPAR